MKRGEPAGPAPRRFGQPSLTGNETSRRVEIPPSRSSPCLRARANTTSSCCWLLAGKNRRRLIVRIAQPSFPVGCSVAENCWYGVGVAYTSAPSTGRPWHAVTWKLTRIVLVSRVTGDGAMRWRLICRRIGGASRSTSIGPVPVGQPAVPEPCVTTAVCADVAVFEPVVFVAVTATRIVLPLSVLVSVYVLCVADAIAAHVAPFVSQR